MSGTRVSINGIDLYHEVHGTGRPLVVLHGGVMNAESCFGAMIPRLAEAHQVIAVDLQGHGHTADTERPITLANLAADVVGLLDGTPGARDPPGARSNGGPNRETLQPPNRDPGSGPRSRPDRGLPGRP